MTDLLGKAFSFAFHAHAGHVDKSGEVYLTHLVRVACRMQDDDSRAIALLHDTVEDTEVTEADLRAAFAPHIADAVMALTKRDGEPLGDYMTRVAQNPLALPVKIADIADNSSPTRMQSLPPEMQVRLRDKYSTALALLNAGTS